MELLTKILAKIFNFLINVVLMSMLSSILISTVLCFLFVFFYFEAVKAPLPNEKKVHGEEVPPPSVSIFRRNLGELDENFIVLTHLSQKYLNEFQNFENLKEDIAPTEKPPFCRLICKDSIFDDEVYKIDRVPYLKSFQEAQKTAAWSDPWFRLRYGEMDFLTYAIPHPLREVFRLPPEPDTSFLQLSRWKKALRIELELLRQGEGTIVHYREVQSKNENLNKLRLLVMDCEHSEQKAMALKCTETFPDGSPLD